MYSVDEASALMGVSRTTLYTLLAAGELQSVSICRRRLIARVSLEQFINDRLALRDCAASGLRPPKAALGEGTVSDAASP